MPRYFLEVAYKGTHYSGFQIQENANTVQSEIEKAIATLQRSAISLTGSSRTDAGVHALQNYFHFDFTEVLHPQFIYKLNALLPYDIVVKKVLLMPDDAHSRFDAISRKYRYYIHSKKNPFLKDTSYYFPYRLKMEDMFLAAEHIKTQTNFYAFSKTNTQVKNYSCKIILSEWEQKQDELIYTIEGNRFLRGMVRLITASLLRVGRGKMSLGDFKELFDGKKKCGYSVPSHGLFLTDVIFPVEYFNA